MGIKTGIDVSMVREAVEGVKKQVSRQYVKECNRKKQFPKKLWKTLADQGLLGLSVPEELGGTGGGVTEVVALTELLAGAGLDSEWLVITGLVREAIIKHGDEEQKQKYVVPTMDGSVKLCFAITEPNAGTNSFKIETLAKKTPNGSYLLNGQKTFITGFKEADYCLLVSRTESHGEVSDRKQGMSLFMIDTKAKGITATPIDMGGDHSEVQYTVYFEDVEIPTENIIGQEGEGFRYLFSALNPERLIVAASAIGVGDYCLEKAVEYAKIREPFGKPIGSYQGLQHPMAYAKAHLEAARAILYKACDLYDSGQKVGSEANIAKLVAADAGFEATNVALQVFGGSGLDYETDIINFLGKQRTNQIGPVSTQMILNYIGEHVLGLPKSY